jgi:membrane-associated phospholipid phosphatase
VFAAPHRRRRLAVVIAAIAGLVLLTADLLYEGAVRRADGAVSAWVTAHAHRSWDIVLPPLTFVGQRGFVVLPLLVVTVLAMRRTRSARPLAVIAGALLTTAVVVGTMKLAFGRTAPGYGDDLFGAGGLSYPSGHAVNTILIWTLLLRMLAGLYGGGRLRWLRRPGTRAAVVAAVALANAVGMVGLDYHWVSDVVAGWTIGLVLAMLAPSPLPRGYAPDADRAPGVRSRREPDHRVPSG